MRSIAIHVGAMLGGMGMPIVAWAQQRQYEYWGMHDMWGAWGIGMMFMMIVFWGLVIVALVLGIRWLITQGKEPRADSSLEILKRRYARGEIDKEEFEAMKRDLM
ncbi:MAG: SHOCT domain-containing protein [candidate division NC10 bacterium]|nr:SHOCT domain-containing protein [candidate division NC10 bacterium]MEC4669759.1 SHOCT domain-containing protein [Nitrospirota bacterium]